MDFVHCSSNLINSQGAVEKVSPQNLGLYNVNIEPHYCKTVTLQGTLLM